MLGQELGDRLFHLFHQIRRVGMEPLNVWHSAKPSALTFGKLASVENDGDDRLVKG